MDKTLPVYLSWCFLAVGPVVAGEAVEQTDANLEILGSDVANQVLNLAASEVMLLDVPNTPGEPLVLSVPIDGRSCTLDLQPVSLRAPGYQLKVQVADGSLVDQEPGVVRTLRGVVADVVGSAVAGSLLDDGFKARIMFEDGPTYWLEPLAPHIAGVAANTYVLYRSEDVLPRGGECGLVSEAEADAGDMLIGARGPEGACGGDFCVAELGIDADVEYFEDHGNSESMTAAQIEAVINTMNLQYERDVQITHLITAIIVRTHEPDPYSSSDFLELLDQFRDEWLENQTEIPFDTAQLFTGKNLAFGVAGGGRTLGAICTDDAFSVVQSDFNENFSCATDLSAHELGHLWNADHCICVGWTMNSLLTCANGFHPTFTVPEIIAHRDTRTCLDAAGGCEGDANGDGTVDPLDSGFVLSRFGCPVGTGDPSCDAADQNGDGLVDPLDNGFVLARFGGCL